MTVQLDNAIGNFSIPHDFSLFETPTMFDKSEILLKNQRYLVNSTKDGIHPKYGSEIWTEINRNELKCTEMNVKGGTRSIDWTKKLV